MAKMTELCRRHGIRTRPSIPGVVGTRGLEVSEMRRPRQLEEASPGG